MRTSLLFLLFTSLNAAGQNYTSYFTGNPVNVTVPTTGGVCLMGGATESDQAMTWFLNKANGGDVLVLRTTGGNGYNAYMFSQLGVTLNSVETIVCNNASASNDAYVQNKIMQAEAIWIAGGDQWTYVSYWRNTPVASLIDDAVHTRHIAIGGTSAGMAIMGGYYNSAQNGSVTSSVALSNPYSSLVTVDHSTFITNGRLTDVITDTHFDNPDRRGRTVIFMARALTDDGSMLKAIACDEYTAVCIEPNGMASVYGGYPTYDDNAYFIQPNCELAVPSPETCTSNTPLTWSRGGSAVKVYHTHGTTTGSNTFNLVDWRTGTGGTWEHWSVTNGTLITASGSQPNCVNVAVSAKVLLEGPYVSGTGLMNDALRGLATFPVTDPYPALGYTHTGGGNSGSVAPAVLAVSGNNAIVDWVLLELRSSVNPATVLASRSALLQRDGDVVDLDGASPVSFANASGNYYVAVRHRNHLGTMTTSAVPLSSSPAVVDFTSAALSTYGTNARKAVGSTQVFWAGNVMRDNALRYTGAQNDRDPILVRIGGSTPTNTVSGYFLEDVNLSGVVKYTGPENDRDPILVNIGGTVPTSTRTEQLP